ncbi:thiol reductant ABC exporter subunit CydC [Xanthobacter sp. KR7-65]|uniref:thiol reductant ABC exporter subunit CydC n=1 Tax=Xanthobacter sp. KR7-65 TaxID=3156612 RepID=UPI0032B36FBA
MRREGSGAPASAASTPGAWAVFFRLLAAMRRQAGWMALAVLLSAAASLAHVGLMAASGWFISAMALAGVAGAAMNPFTASAAIRAFALLRTVARYAERLLGHDATLRFVADLRPWFFRRLVPLAPAVLEGERSGDLLARLAGDIDRMEFAFLRILSPALTAVVVVLVAVAFAALWSGAAALVLAVLALLAGGLIPLAVHRLGAAASARVARDTGAFEAALVDHLEGQAELLVYDGDGRHRRRVEAAGDALLADARHLAGVAAAGTAGVGFAGQAALLGVLLAGAPVALGGALAGPDLVMLALMALALFDALAPLPAAVQALPATLASARRLFALADRAPPVAEAGAADVPAQGTLAFRNVCLTYPGATRPALAGIDLDLVPGRRVAVVGPSGSGKSSLVALALRFRAADAGRITFAGRDVALLDADALRRRLAVLQQHDHVFAATVAENLALADPQAPPARRAAACATAGILDVIDAEPDGFATFVGAHGASLSGGQARRLNLARTLLKDAPLLILDEPLEGLDTQTARAVIAAVLDEARDRAVLLITHRASGLDLMDEIVLMNEGRIADRGSASVMLPKIAALRADDAS